MPYISDESELVFDNVHFRADLPLSLEYQDIVRAVTKIILKVSQKKGPVSFESQYLKNNSTTNRTRH